MGLKFCICLFFRISFNSTLFRISALDSVNSKFLRVVFSRMLSRFCVLFCFFAKRSIPLSPLLKPRKSRHFFAALYLQPVGSFAQPQSVSFGRSATHDKGECRYALACYTFDLIFALLGLVLPHALLFIFGKALHKVFEVGDCVSCLDSLTRFLFDRI